MAVESDSKGESKYVVGGRIYFEASVRGVGVHSFTYKGFFDQEGYEEPKSTLNKIKSSGVIWIVLGSIAGLLIIIGLYMCYCRKEDHHSKSKSD